MSAVIDVKAEVPRLADRVPARDLTPGEVAPLAEELAAYAQHFAPLFYRREQREWAAVYLRGLLTAEVPRKNVEAMALRLMGAGSHAERQVRALQQFIGEGRWDDDAVLAEHQRLVNKTLGEEDGVLIIDGSDFPKHGRHSVGVAPQWCGNTGKKDNCQAGVFLGYASRKGATLLDRRLYLPESWFGEDHQALWQDCRIPEGIPFQTKHELAAQLVEQVMAGGRLKARLSWCATRDMATRLPSWSAWTGRGCGIWPRCRGTPKSGPCCKPMGKRNVSAQAVGCRPRPARVKGLPPDASGCIPRARSK